MSACGKLVDVIDLLDIVDSGDAGSRCIAADDLGTVSISGRITFDRIPLSAASGLDFSSPQIMPAREVTVVLLDVRGVPVQTGSLDTGRTDANGEYRFTRVPANQYVQLRVYAELFSNNLLLGQWDIKVRDNTQFVGGEYAVYGMEGSLRCSGTEDSVRDLHAPSGWDLSLGAYVDNKRIAAPFAILDSLYKVLQLLQGVDSGFNLPELDVFWSEKNNTTPGSFSEGDYDLGEIGSSQYLEDNSSIYLLGKADDNTDEFDEAVIIHEWSHYFEDNLSRFDSIGGRHSITDKLDMRVAFSEGLANTVAGVVLDDSLFQNSLGPAQATVSSFDLEANPGSAEAGWFVESSIHSFLYDIYDANDDGADTLSLGWSALYDVLISQAYRRQASLASIFSFSDQLLSANVGSADAIETLLRSQNIYGVGIYGDGEVVDGGDMDNLPIYQQLVVNGAEVKACVNKYAGEFNRLGVRDFIRFTSLGGKHKITVTYDAASSTLGMPSDPAIRVFRQGRFFDDAPVVNQQGSPVVLTRDFPDDVDNKEYIIEVFERSNLDGDLNTGGSACFDVDVKKITGG